METADVTLSLLIHMGIWMAMGAAAGAAIGIGSGSRDVLVRSLVGGITGAAPGTILFDMSGAFVPLAHTERPLSVEAGTRLAANRVLCLCVAIGIVVVASQTRRVASRPTRLDDDAFLQELADDRHRAKQGRLPRSCSSRPTLLS
jgi:hypothetical protein